MTALARGGRPGPDVGAAFRRPERLAIVLLVAIPLLFTAAVLIDVRLNRGGDDLRAPIELSEREVSLSPRSADNTATVVWLSWADRLRPPRELRGTRELPRRVFVALAIDPARAEGSRLVVVDVDPDAAVLEQRYPDGRTHLITAGLARSSDVVVNLDPVRIHVPRELAAALPYWPATRTPDYIHAPFTLSLQYGRHWEPWVIEIAD